MKKKLIFALVALPVIFGAFKLTDRVTFDRNEWLEDFEQLKHEIENNYANLKWARTSKQANLVELDRIAIAALQQARTQSEARAVLARFIEGFKDAHFQIESGPPRPIAAVLELWPEGAGPAVDFSMTSVDVCAALGYADRRNTIELDHPALTEKDNTEFASGVLSLDGGRKYGIIRIPLFQQYHYGQSCERAWESFRKDHKGVCDQACQDDFYEAAKHEVAAQLAREASALLRQAPSGIVIDLTGNGGGTEWADHAAAALTPIPLKPPAQAFVRGPHWGASFGRDARKFAKIGATSNLAHARALRDSARVKCDVSGIWNDHSYEPLCWNVVTRTPYSVESSQDLGQREPYRGRLYIMVDEHTASAAELFAAVLQDNNAAVVIGTRTMGVGCGYTNGGIDVTLRNSRLAIAMPDCARMRADGSNEYEGVEPNVVADWGETPAAKGRALAEALRSLD